MFATGDSITKAKLWSWYDTPIYNFSLYDEIVHVVKAFEYISQSNFDIIHNHAYTFGPALLNFSSIPHVTTFHDMPYKPLMHYFEAFSSKNQYISISQSQQKAIPLNWIGNVYNAINVADFAFEANKEEYLLFIGNVAPWKGPHLAIQVARKLQRRLKIAGPVHKADYYEQEIAPYVDGSLIEYIGEVDFAQKVSLYQNAAVLLVPISWEEPFGLVMIEALACGTPVIAFMMGAAPEIIVDGQVGFLVTNVDEMAAAVKNISKISPWKCREHVERNFDTKLMADRYIELYQKTLENWP